MGNFIKILVDNKDLLYSTENYIDILITYNGKESEKRICIYVCVYTHMYRVSLVAELVKNLPANAGDTREAGLIPGLGRSLGGGYGDPVQHSCLENPHGQRSLVGCSPWGREESDTTELICMHTYTCITESLCSISEINTTL